MVLRNHLPATFITNTVGPEAPEAKRGFQQQLNVIGKGLIINIEVCIEDNKTLHGYEMSLRDNRWYHLCSCSMSNRDKHLSSKTFSSLWLVYDGMIE